MTKYIAEIRRTFNASEAKFDKMMVVSTKRYFHYEAERPAVRDIRYPSPLITENKTSSKKVSG